MITKNNAVNSRSLRKIKFILQKVLSDCKPWGRFFVKKMKICQNYSSSAAGRMDLNQAFHLAIALSR